ncbi:hypothetical protein D3C87_1165660 [compost metagenome]
MKTGKTIFEYQSYRDFLRDHLAKAQERNASFSLRSYAQKLGITASYLSEVLSGKKNLSTAKAAVIGLSLGLNHSEQQYFLEIVQVSDTKNNAALGLLQDRLDNFQRPIKREFAEAHQFEMLATWYLIPVLEMTVSAHYQGQSADIAHVLGISEVQVTEAIQHLHAMGAIEPIADGGWAKCSGHLILSSEKHNQALKKFHCNLLEKYQRALYDQTPQERYTGSETILIDREQIPEAHKIMNECLDKLVNLLSKNGERTEPYHLHFGMFSLRRKIVSDEEAS